ncbi:MAG: MraY family glycosyltransferase [Candidatus Wallbacteria bacterium]|nr:MraY family glycosyltransferase [Candidatus Wallbacteria bacterium]
MNQNLAAMIENLGTDSLTVFAFALLFNAVLIPFLILLSNKMGLFDQPEFRKIHKHPIPRMGGLGIFTTFFIISLMFLPSLFTKHYLFLTLMFFLIGFSDDLHTINYKTRLGLTIVSSLLFIVIFKVWISHVGIFLPVLIAIPFTVFAISGFINAFNMIDGLNGLSSGVALISFGSLFYLSSLTHETLFQTMLAIIAGATLSFFLINFFLGSIFIGDGGTYSLGFLIVTFSIFFGFYHPEISSWCYILINIYPVYEILLTIFRRRAKGRKPFLPDKVHFHHLLLKHFKNQKQTTACILFWEFSFALFACTFYYSTTILFTSFLFFLLVYYFLYRFLLRKAGNFNGI